jgi:putative membrane protein insertion efficiency factor
MKLFSQAFSFLFIGVITFYQRILSPILPSSCRYTPTCSQYMKEAIQIHGVLKGTYLGVRRILRCHPWGGCGFDPVPGSQSHHHHHSHE